MNYLMVNSLYNGSWPFICKTHMDKLGNFIKNRRKNVKEETLADRMSKLPWYRRQLDKEEFTYRQGKDGRYYVQHHEWHETIYVGPYKSVNEAEDIIDSYVTESQKIHLDKKLDSRIHSVKIENLEDFF